MSKAKAEPTEEQVRELEQHLAAEVNAMCSDEDTTHAAFVTLTPLFASGFHQPAIAVALAQVRKEAEQRGYERGRSDENDAITSQLARLRSHSSHASFLDVLSTADTGDEHSDYALLLLQLLRGDTGQGG